MTSQYPPPQGPPPSGPPPASGVSLNKLTLTKSAPSVSLSKQGGVGGQMRVNLNWNARPQGGGGFFKRLTGGGGAIDLDLGCLYELTDGRKGVVQALGNAFGALDRPPYIQLDADDRSGASTGGENLFINLDQARNIRRILVFAFIYEGVPAWDQAGGVVTLFPAQGQPIEVRLDESAAGARSCAIAHIDNSQGQFEIRREVQYITGAQDALDRAYGWGMNWQAGRK
jgi:tellurite resistance protein TerA